MVLRRVLAVAAALSAGGCWGATAPDLPWMYHQFRSQDFRYPDYIVQPQVPCVSEGYFMHPRDCSWYYRCQNNTRTTAPGLYAVTYHKCGAGTVFVGGACSRERAKGAEESEGSKGVDVGSTTCRKKCEPILRDCRVVACQGSSAKARMRWVEVCGIAVYDCSMNPVAVCGNGEMYDVIGGGCVEDPCQGGRKRKKKVGKRKKIRDKKNTKMKNKDRKRKKGNRD